MDARALIVTGALSAAPRRRPRKRGHLRRWLLSLFR